MANPIARFFGFGSPDDSVVAGAVGNSATNGIRSPWQDGSLAPFVWSDIFGVDNTPVTRLEALRVPAVARARSVIISLIASRPLKMYNGDGTIATDQPTWLYRSDTGVSPYQRNLGILDDLIFNDSSLLVVTRGAKGQITDAVHLPFDRWSVNSDGKIVVDGNIAQEGEVVWIPGPGPGLLVTGAETIRGARNMERAWAGRVRNPTPTILLHQKEQGTLTADEVKGYLTGVREARQDPDGTVAFIPYEVDVTTDGSQATDLFTAGRNDVRIDIANHTNLPVNLLDGSTSTASLTYSTQEGKRNEVFDYSVPYWTNSIEQALSLDNVVPRGSYVRFDFSDLLSTIESPTGPEAQD